ncbi:LEAF RUST 10 DISEASE-RESISTANCE LOCUS RECEPTOR-LIKE PROTEIN KINASE-like 1.2 isoform X2 [Panicum virgatum]|nr:LEAF RUST 10 DISEASE-RESISTANCE LOCUS RECEPTOR-LIKE PROTEIN KINASE-like 1.2 isoform X2 [Panicum virgatum]
MGWVGLVNHFNWLWVGVDFNPLAGLASALFLLFVCSALVASPAPLMTAAAQAGSREGENCPPFKLCGSVNISFPFAILPEQTMETRCGLIGFQVRCTNNTPYLGYNRQNHWFQILDIFYDNASLVVVDVRKLEAFAGSSASKPCHLPMNNSSNKIGLPFSVSPANQNLILYSCSGKPPAEAVRQSRGLVETVCSNDSFFGVVESYDASGSYGSYSLEGCSATIVPVLGSSSGKANVSRYEELIACGFLLTWQVPYRFHRRPNCQ